jgi:cathepsin A (carboxypeptidase C)
VQQRLGFNTSIPFDLIDMDANTRWQEDGHVMLPATRELTWLLDETDVRILFINGNEDIIM